ncbi:MAG: Hydroxyacylglutathione hydrolase [Hyphomicrobiaceae bacterium hypho_1]
MSKQDFKASIDFVYGEPKTLFPGVQRIVANNPSSLTFRGTNTYIVGQGNDLAVIDPGPKDESHFVAIMAATMSKRITHIFITHSHPDHIGGLERLASATGAEVCAYRQNSHNGRIGSENLASYNAYYENVVPTIELLDGDYINIGDWTLTAVFTPGHAPDHLCFQLNDTGVLFSGDHVMGWNTSLVAPPEGQLRDYLLSLETLLKRNDSVYYPGHGNYIKQPKQCVKNYILHSELRQKFILAAIRNGCCTITDIVPRIYKKLDQNLNNAAILSVQAHIEYLSQKGLVHIDQPITLTSNIAASKST